MSAISMESVADARRRTLVGLLEALGFVVAIACLTILYAVGLERGAHPVVIVLVAMLVCALVLIAGAGGPGRDALAIMRAPQSFLIGLATIGLEVFYAALLLHASPAEASLFVRFAIPMALVAGWLVLGRRPSVAAAVAGLVVVAMLARLTEGLGEADRLAAPLYGLSVAFCFAIRSFASELHPWNRAASSLRERLRVTGLVVLSSSLLCVGLTAVAVLAVLAGILPATPLLPRLEQFAHGPSWLVAIVVGGATLTAMYYLSFSSVVKIRSERFVAVTVLTPPATLLAQIAAVSAGIVRPVVVEDHVLAVMVVIVAAALAIVWASSRPPSN
jgi:drug/metabolite transporter (DMT)-like permease